MATNKPDTLDDAFTSRIDLKISIDPPSQAARERIFRIHIEERGYCLNESSISYADLAKRTDGMSGRDIQTICKNVLLSILAAKNSQIPQLVDGGKIKDYTLQIRPVTKQDFEEALAA